MEQTIPKILRKVAAEHGEKASHYKKNEKGDFIPTTFAAYYDSARDFGAGLLSIGIERGAHIGLISDNRQEWAIADMGLLMIGAIDVPRGCDATERELGYILSFAECKTVIVENAAQLKKVVALRDNLPLISSIICIENLPRAENDGDSKATSNGGETAKDGNKSADAAQDAPTTAAPGIALYTYAQILERGAQYRAANPGAIEAELEKGEAGDIATIIFTSGTTGEPKGVVLTHSNFITQLDELPERIPIKPGDKAICVLPVWHAFQRLCEYVILVTGAAVCYSKPIGSILLADFLKLNPRIIPGVPRVFEAIYDGVMRTMRKTGGITLVLFKFFVQAAILFSRIDRLLFGKTAQFKKPHRFFAWSLLVIPWLLLLLVRTVGDALVFKKIRAKLGNNFLAGVSGGGAFPPAVDEFFWAVGISIVEGYGLTETAPVIAVRPIPKPVFGTVGKPIRGVEVRVVDEKGDILPPGVKGSVLVRGGIVMQGYYKKPDVTAQVIDRYGWFDTGDLGMLTINGELVLRGRKKDTIVLRGGENIEPLPIEMRLSESRFITQAVVLGQDERGNDQRFLAALVVPAKDELVAFAKENAIRFGDYKELLTQSEVLKMFDDEVKNLVNAKSGFRMFERINKIVLLEKPFEVGKELSAKQEIMRHKIRDIYAKEIHELFK